MKSRVGTKVGAVLSLALAALVVIGGFSYWTTKQLIQSARSLERTHRVLLELEAALSHLKDAETGEVVELHCTYDPATRGGDSPDGRKVKGTLHWVSADHALNAEVRLYDHLFSHPDPHDVPEGQDFLVHLNPSSLETLTACQLEPSLASATAGQHFQFERLGYFCVDRDSVPGNPVFNRTVTLKDSWAKMAKKAT